MTRIFRIYIATAEFLAGIVQDRKGTVAVLLALALSAIVGFAGLGSEVASWYYTKRAMQSASDFAATSAAAELAEATVAGSTISGTELTNTGRSVAATFHFGDGANSTTVGVSNPPGTTTGLATCSSPFTSYNCYVEVVISQPQPALLSALFMSSGPTITSRSVALANTKVADQGCVMALDPHADVGLQTQGSPALTLNS
jgi:uncharacterized membrane protein